MGCCSSRKTTAAVAADDVPLNKQNGYHATENTGAVGNNVSNDISVTAATSDTNGVNQNPSFTITPKYTASVNVATLPTGNLDRTSEASPKVGPVFPSTSGYQDKDNRQRGASIDFLTPGQTTDVLSSYSNTEHLRASPYLSGMGNRKQYDRAKLDSETFRGFDVPVTNSDSENGFDSDIEREEAIPKKSEVRSHSADKISLSSIMNERSKQGSDLAGIVESKKLDEPVSSPSAAGVESQMEVVELGETLDGGAKEQNKTVNTVASASVQFQSSSVPEAVERLGTPTYITTRMNSPKAQRKSPTVSRSGTPRPRSPKDPIMETLEDAFYRFARYGEVNSEGREMNNKNWAKLCRDCDFVDNRSILTGDVDVIFSRHKPKGQRLIDFDMFVKCLEEVADRKHKSIQDHKERRRKVFENVIGKAPEYVGITGVSKTGNVVRMTDHSLYPATHKMRFDEEGRGLGIDEMQVYDPTEHGYVQGYKDKDTYDLKVSRPSSRSSIRLVSRETSNISRSSPNAGRRRLQ